MLSSLPQTVVILTGALTIPLILLPLWGLPRVGAPHIGDRGLGGALFHLGMGLMSIGLIALAGSARAEFPKFQFFREHKVWFELACALASLMAVSPLIAILLTARPPADEPPRPAVSIMVRTALSRFALACVPLQVLECCILLAMQIFHIKTNAQVPLVEFHESGVLVRAALIISIGLAVPVAEEVVFRGTLQPALARFLGLELACLSTAVIFGILHDPVAAVPIGILGYFLGRVRDACGSVVPCIAIHAANNMIALFLYATVPAVRELYHSTP